jgi:streptogramin lyase
MWFTENSGNRIGRITPTGVTTEFSGGISRGSGLTDITAGPDGNLWFTESGLDRVGRITPAGIVTEFSKGISREAQGPAETPGSVPIGITAGPDGNLWFTEYQGNRIGRITPTGVVTEFSKGLSPGASPSGITSGPDGNLWFAESYVDRIGRITPVGVVTEFMMEGNVARWPLSITAGPDGNLWFTEEMGNRIGRITPAGVITEFSRGITPGFRPERIAAGPDGNLWFTETETEPIGAAQGRIARITPAGLVTEFSKGISPGTSPLGIATGPDGNMWFTEHEGNRIGRITTTGVMSEFPATAQILRIRQAGMRVSVRLRCPLGAALPCKGTVRLGKTGNGGARRLAPLAAGQSTTVVIPFSASWRRLLAKRGKLSVKVWLLPEAHSVAGALAQPITLRAASHPRIPAVTG